jgi:hypothetical protein
MAPAAGAFMHYNSAMMHRIPAYLSAPPPRAPARVPAMVPDLSSILLFLYIKEWEPDFGCEGRSDVPGLVCFLHYPTACMP